MLITTKRECHSLHNAPEDEALQHRPGSAIKSVYIHKYVYIYMDYNENTTINNNDNSNNILYKYYYIIYIYYHQS